MAFKKSDFIIFRYIIPFILLLFLLSGCVEIPQKIKAPIDTNPVSNKTNDFVSSKPISNDTDPLKKESSETEPPVTDSVHLETDEIEYEHVSSEIKTDLNEPASDEKKTPTTESTSNNITSTEIKTDLNEPASDEKKTPTTESTSNNITSTEIKTAIGDEPANSQTEISKINSFSSEKEEIVNGSSASEPITNDNFTDQNSKQNKPVKPDSTFDERKQINASIKKEMGKIENNIDEDEKISSITRVQHSLDEALGFCEVAQDLWQKGELDNALEALDQAYSLILKVDNYDEPNLMQQKEDLRFMISKRILEIYASRNIVVSGNHNAIPIVMNKHVQAEIDLFKGAERKFFIQSYKRSGKYRPKIVAALKKAGIPVELSWLPLIESGFKVRALSRSRALGLWQFIPSTGYKFGLNRNIYVDERLDPEKATKSAIEYLKELHQIFGDWSTVLAAYNCGEGRVLRVIRTQKVNYLDNFWDLYERLPRETARYVPKFMATLHIINNPEIIGLDSIDVYPPLKYESITISKQAHLKDIAKKIEVSYQILKELNPELRYKILPETSHSIRVPPGKSQVLLEKIDTIPVSSKPIRPFVYHRVRPGESLSVIARRYRTSVSSIVRANNIRRSNFIVAGKRLKIPSKGATITKSKKIAKRNYKRASKHVVKRGDSLWIIAKRYGTTTRKIRRINNLYTNTLQIGQVLKIPGQKDESPPKDGLKFYFVKRGDSPYHIAKQHNMSLGHFLRINNLTPRSRIYPNQRLYVE